MKIQVLPGDSLTGPFKATNIGGEIAVCRECLIAGDVRAESLVEFWQVRENYLKAVYPTRRGFYQKKVRREFEKLLNLPPGAEVNLWFEYELFCQVNMWFCLWLLKNTKAKIYRIAPVMNDEKDIWKGFGALGGEDLQKSFAGRKKFNAIDIELGANLWEAFQDKDFDALEILSQTDSECFPMIKEVCRAEIEKDTRPKKALQKIMADGENKFDRVFRKFNETEGVYGFGDLQVRRIYEELL